MVPNGWKLTSLGDISSKVQTGPFGSQLHAHEYTDEGIPVLMPKDLINGRADINSAAKITETRADDLAKHKLKKGDILFSRRGDVARFGLITEESEGALCGTGCLKASISKEHSALFLSYFLQKSAVRKWLEQNAVGQTMLNLNTTILSELPIMVASSKQEQQKIAKILSTWDKAISTTELLIENSTQQKKALMQQLLTGKKRLTGFDEEWIAEPLEKVVGKIYGGGTPSKNVPEYWDGDIPWVTVKDLIATKIDGAQQYINKFGLENSSANIVPAGTVIIATRMALGKAVIASCDVAINQDLKAITGSPKIDSVFLHYWLLLEAKVIEKLGTGSTVKGVQLETIKSLRMHIPSSIQEQQKIATVLTNADREIELLKQQLTDLQQEKKALMQVLLTGKKRVVVD